jgi:uncharacterized protein YbbK (DUF523 family)
MTGMKRILVSACLMGRPVRYDGSARTLVDRHLEAWRAEGRLVSFCPEVAAGLPTPRPPAEIAPGATAADVLSGLGAVSDVDGTDVTDAFLTAARLTVAEARRTGCRWALLTDGSPSCGTSFIYSGHFDSVRRGGRGLVAEALLANGIAVFAPTDIEQLAEAVKSTI